MQNLVIKIFLNENNVIFMIRLSLILIKDKIYLIFLENNYATIHKIIY